MRTDITLLHPPSYLYFREEKRKFGPISDVIPSTPIFDMYPYGFFSLATYLNKKGYRVDLYNVAARMVLDESFDVNRFVEKLDADVVGIDLHWLVHAHGALELARKIKQERPDITIMLGGLSSTIFHREIMEKFPWVDIIALGDTTEPVVDMLLDHRSRGKSLESVPNIAYREGKNIKVNSFSYVPKDISDYSIDYHKIFSSLFHASEPFGWIPFANFIEHPIGAILLYKGCRYNCLACGGSSYTYRKYFGRRELAFKSNDAILKELSSIVDHIKIPVFLVGDIQLLGRERAEDLIRKIKSEGLQFYGLFMEFYTPPPLDLIEKLTSLDTEVYFQISPESHIEEVRRFYGRLYGNDRLKDFVKGSIKLGAKRVDLYFMVGLAKQKLEHMETFSNFIRDIYREVPENERKRIDFFISPLAPFVDPGSLAFDFPEKFGYRIRARTLAEHVELIKNSLDWREMLNYETEFMNRENIAQATYIGAKALTIMKKEQGILEEDEAEKILLKLNQSYSEDIRGKETTDLRDLYPSEPLYNLIDEKRSEVLIMAIKKSLGLE